MVPADGVVAADEAVLDESALTGEALPVAIARYGHVRSGTANAGNAFDLRVTSPAAESAYAAIVRLVQAAEIGPGAVHAPRRPLRRLLPPLLARRRRARLARLRKLDPGARGDGRGDAVPADPCSADRLRGRSLACRARGNHRQGRGSARAARRGEDRPARQDRHAHARPAGAGTDRPARRPRPRTKRCGSRPRSTRCRPTSSPRASSSAPPGAASSSPSRPASGRSRAAGSSETSRAIASRLARVAGSRRTAISARARIARARQRRRRPAAPRSSSASTAPSLPSS